MPHIVSMYVCMHIHILMHLLLYVRYFFNILDKYIYEIQGIYIDRSVFIRMTICIYIYLHSHEKHVLILYGFIGIILG